MRRLGKACAIGLLIGSLGGLLALTPLGVMLEERLGLTWLFRLRGPLPPPADVAVISLDRDSAQRLALPERIHEWPRSVHARLIERLVAAGASVIVFDVLFDRPRAPAHDRALEQAIAAAGRVVLFEYLHEEFRLLPGPQGAVAGLLATKQLRPPLPELVAAAAGTGPFPLPREHDRVSDFFAFAGELEQRPTLPAVALQRHALPALADWAALLRAAGLREDQGVLVADPAAVADAAALTGYMRALRNTFVTAPELARRLRARLVAAEVDDATRRLLAALIALYDGPDRRYLDFYGPAGSVWTVPLAALLEQDAPPDLAGRVVLVGRSELINRSEDDFATVFTGLKGTRISGVEVAATAVANLLEGRLLEPVALPATLAWVTSFGLVVSLIARLLPALLAVPLALAFAGAGQLGAQLAFARAGLWLPMTIPLLVQLPLGLVVGLLLQHREAQRAQANVRRGLRYYLPERVVAGFAEAPLDPRGIKEQLYAACMVTDAERFTSLAEELPPPQVGVFLDRYFALLFGIVARHGGQIIDVVGDGTTCIWRAAQPDRGCHRSACLAALDIIEELAGLNRDGQPLALPTRIGLNAGWVMVGNVGGGERFAYSVIGDCVNTAARLESLNKQLGTRILVTEAVVDELTELLLRPLGRFLVIGRIQPLRLVEIRGRRGGPCESGLLAAYSAALARFESGCWAEAAAGFEAILARYPADGAARLHLDRCRRYLAGAPLPPDPTVIRLEHK
jgi:adenylate cyclase